MPYDHATCFSLQLQHEGCTKRLIRVETAGQFRSGLKKPVAGRCPLLGFFHEKNALPLEFFFMKKTRAGGASSRSTQSGPNLPKRAHWPHWRGSGTERWAIGRSWPRGSRVWSIRGEEAVVPPDRQPTWEKIVASTSARVTLAASAGWQKNGGKPGTTADQAGRLAFRGVTSSGRPGG